MGKDLKGKELGTGFCQRTDGRYMFRFTSVTGDRKNIYARTLIALKREVKDIKKIDLLTNASEEDFLDGNLVKLRAKIKANKKKEDEGLTLNEVFEKFIFHKENIEQIKITTIDVYKRGYNFSLKNEFGSKKINSFSSNMLRDIVNCELKKLNKISKPKFGLLKNILLFAYNQGYMQSKVEYCLPKENNNKTKEKEIASEETYRLIIDNCKNNSMKNMIIISYNTGLRLGEVLGITTDSINFNNRTILIDKQYISKLKERMYGTPKNGKSRMVPINSECEQALRNQLSIMRTDITGIFSKSIFVTQQNRDFPPQGISDLFRRFVDKLIIKGIIDPCDISFHSFRHTFITNSIKSGISTSVVSSIAGHSSLKMTEHYTHIDNEFSIKEFLGSVNKDF